MFFFKIKRNLNIFMYFMYDCLFVLLLCELFMCFSLFYTIVLVFLNTVKTSVFYVYSLIFYFFLHILFFIIYTLIFLVDLL